MVYFSSWPVFALAGSTCKCVLSCVRPFCGPKGAGKLCTKQLAKTCKSRRSPRRSPPVSTAFLVVTYFPCATFVGEHPSSGSKTSKNHQHHQHHPTDSDQLHSCSIIFPNFPHIFRFFPLRSPGFLQLQRQHQRLRALSALVRSPGPGEFPLGAAAAAQRHHVGCHRGRHAIKPGAPRGEVEELSPLPHLSGDGKSWEDLWIVLGKF